MAFEIVLSYCGSWKGILANANANGNGNNQHPSLEPRILMFGLRGAVLRKVFYVLDVVGVSKGLVTRG